MGGWVVAGCGDGGELSVATLKVGQGLKSGGKRREPRLLGHEGGCCQATRALPGRTHLLGAAVGDVAELHGSGKVTAQHLQGAPGGGAAACFEVLLFASLKSITVQLLDAGTSGRVLRSGSACDSALQPQPQPQQRTCAAADTM